MAKGFEMFEAKGIRGFLSAFKFIFIKLDIDSPIQDSMLSKNFGAVVTYFKRKFYKQRIFLIKFDDELIGMVCIVPRVQNNIAFIYILKAERSKGYGLLALKYMRKNVGNIWGRTHNPAMVKVFERCGMKHRVQRIDIYEDNTIEPVA